MKPPKDNSLPQLTHHPLADYLEEGYTPYNNNTYTTGDLEWDRLYSPPVKKTRKKHMPVGLTHAQQPVARGRGSINLGGMQSPMHWMKNTYGKGVDYLAPQNRMTHRLPSVSGMGAANIGGGQSPGHHTRNPYGKGVQYGGYAPKPSKSKGLAHSLGMPDFKLPKEFRFDPNQMPDEFNFDPNQVPGMPSFGNMPSFGDMGGGDGGGSGFFGGGFAEPPAPGNTHVDSSIAPLFNEVQQNFMPDNVVRTGINQQFADLQRQANPQTMLEQYGANQNNMTSAASGQHQPLMMAQMAEPYQQAAMLQGEGPLQAAQQHYDLQGKGLNAQSNEILQMHNQANNWYRDRLQNWRRLNQQQNQALNLIFRR